jgi:hypothetical protein
MKELQDAGEIKFQCDFHTPEGGETEIRWVIITRPGIAPISDERMLDLLQWNPMAALEFLLDAGAERRRNSRARAAACPEASEASVKASVSAEE